MKNKDGVKSSFRDPCGYVFMNEGIFYRHINDLYKDDYDLLMNSGLYSALIDKELMIRHEEVEDPRAENAGAYKIIRPQRVEFISYPYEWCFGELKDAALCLLQIQQSALRFGMSLKDGNAYNIQFQAGKPKLIDTLSFEVYDESKPWIAYRQFCQHFLAPLYIMAYKDVRLSQLLKQYIDGIPLDLASTLLPFSSRFSFAALFHIHLHGRNQTKQTTLKQTISFSRNKMVALVENLMGAVEAVQWKPKQAQWVNYYQETNYTDKAMMLKKNWVTECIDAVSPDCVWDIGANTGEFSRLVRNASVVAFDYDEGVTEINYQRTKSCNETNILPLVMDLNNPSPSLGWAGEERMSLEQRGPVDLAFALALIHHLVIGNNLSFEQVANYFSKCCKNLVIEFVPKTDSQVQRLLSSRADVFAEYSIEGFEAVFGKYFAVRRRQKIEETERTIYLMEAMTE